jgi:DNA-binding HxlR family transcriptional regulator
MQPETISIQHGRRKPGKTGAGSHDVSGCAPAREVLARIGDKWTMLIVVLLGGGSLRFNELKRRTGGITQRMLSLTLKNLERDGLVSRHVTPTAPPQVDYTLTPLGCSLWSLVKSLGQWAGENHARIQSARSEFDGLGAKVRNAHPAMARSAAAVASSAG